MHRITLLGSHHAQLVSHLDNHPEGHERAAFILFKKIARNVKQLKRSDRYISVDIILFPKEWIISSSPTHVDFHMSKFREIFRRCDDEKLTLAFVHNHPCGNVLFSNKDTDNELTLLKAISNRNEGDTALLSLLWTNQQWLSHIRFNKMPDDIKNTRHLTVLSESIMMYQVSQLNDDDEGIFSRQMAALGKPLTEMLQSLRIAIVGAGGTGSPLAILLARCGVGELIIIDNDKLEKSNLNRVRGAKLSDVGKNKAKILADYINSLGLPCKAIPFDALIDEDIDAIDALSTADMIFGCTDDKPGRGFLNKASYVHMQAYIDIGLGGNVAEDKHGVSRLINHHGRISTILPEFGHCLFCQREITDKQIHDALIIRNNPDLSEKEKKEKYIEDGGEQAPGVGPFTGMSADMAVATLFELLYSHRRLPDNLLKDNIWIDFIGMRIKSNSPINDLECPYCGTRNFIAMSESDGRLGRPSLGVPDEFV